MSTISFQFINRSHASHHKIKIPHSQPVSRLDLVKVFLSVENGAHANHPKVEFIQCVAFRLDPADPNISFNDIDGEVVQAGRIQARVIPGKLNVFA